MVVSQSNADTRRLRAAFVRDAGEHRVVRQQRIAREVHLRHHAREERLAEEREMDVRRPPGVVVVAPGILARADGDEAVAALGVGDGAPGAGEVRVERRVVLVGLVRVAARRSSPARPRPAYAAPRGRSRRARGR